jgi:hypothetical protein
MTQNFVRKNLKEVDVLKRNAELLGQFLGKPMDPKLCAYASNEGKLYRDRLADPKLIPPEYVEDFARTSPIERESALEYLDLVAKACSTESATSKIALKEYLLTQEVGACRVGSHRWTETFKREGTTAVWVTVSEPEGECGVVQHNKFEHDKFDPTFWRYSARKTIAKKEVHIAPLGKCSGIFDDQAYTYSWKSRDLYLNCKTIKFSPF